MKILSIIFASLFAMAAMANWVPKSTLKTTNNFWAKQAKCESSSGESCFDLTGKDRRKWKVGFLMPQVPSTVDCVDGPGCQASIDDSSFSCQAGVPSFDDKANWPGLDFVADSRPASGWFLWCQVEGLVADAAGEAAADAEDAAKAADKTTRDNAKSQRLTDKDACVAAVNGAAALTPQDIKDCLNILIKEVYEPVIPVGDL